MMSSTQFQMIMRDMLFITWAVPPERLRALVDERLELDIRSDFAGNEIALVSAVTFNVADVRSSVLPLPRLNFGQTNYRVYVRSGETPAVCFLDMRVNSRMVTTLTSFLRVPIHYEDIEIRTAPDDVGLVRYTVESDGLKASAIIGSRPENTSSDEIEPGFVTHRLIGYAGSGDSMFKIQVEQEGLDAIVARVESVNASRLEQLGVLTPGNPVEPCSALYVREASFAAYTPTRVG
jgi:uncharacterized protein YqjF (DUF2071 family)